VINRGENRSRVVSARVCHGDALNRVVSFVRALRLRARVKIPTWSHHDARVVARVLLIFY